MKYIHASTTITNLEAKRLGFESLTDSETIKRGDLVNPYNAQAGPIGIFIGWRPSGRDDWKEEYGCPPHSLGTDLDVAAELSGAAPSEISSARPSISNGHSILWSGWGKREQAELKTNSEFARRCTIFDQRHAYPVDVGRFCDVYANQGTREAICLAHIDGKDREPGEMLLEYVMPNGRSSLLILERRASPTLLPTDRWEDVGNFYPSYRSHELSYKDPSRLVNSLWFLSLPVLPSECLPLWHSRAVSYWTLPRKWMKVLASAKTRWNWGTPVCKGRKEERLHDNCVGPIGEDEGPLVPSPLRLFDKKNPVSCCLCGDPCDFGARGDGPATQEFGLDGFDYSFCGPECLNNWVVVR